VAAEHYWQVTDADFEKALGGAKGGAQVAQKVAANTYAQATQGHATNAENPVNLRADAKTFAQRRFDL
jgi:hypothetical protein